MRLELFQRPSQQIRVKDWTDSYRNSHILLFNPGRVEAKQFDNIYYFLASNIYFMLVVLFFKIACIKILCTDGLTSNS